ncbi:MAG: hypothetical protein NT104_03625 [Bacteroidetes bacterium]|nr:hypothetical protein [Bacteroidota bacterium]
MKLSFNRLSPLAGYLIGMALILISVFLKGLNKLEIIQVYLIVFGLIIQLFAVIAFFKNRKSAKAIE